MVWRIARTFCALCEAFFFPQPSAILMHFSISSETFLFGSEHIFPDRTLRMMRNSQGEKKKKQRKLLIYESCSLASNKQKSLLCSLTISFITAMFYALRRHIGKRPEHQCACECAQPLATG